MQALETNDHPSRIQFDNICRRELRDGAEFLRRIVFMDECVLHILGVVIKNNVKI